jgi:hypothetical protein
MSASRILNFFIVGAPKCGSTAMSEYLRTHPDICFSQPKEKPLTQTEMEFSQEITKQLKNPQKFDFDISRFSRNNIIDKWDKIIYFFMKPLFEFILS